MALVFIAGTALGLACPAPAVVLFSATLASLIIGTVLTIAPPRFAAAATAFHLATLLGLGWINASLATATSDRAIPRVMELPAGAMIRGIVTDEPVEVVSRNGKSTWKFPLQVESVRTHGMRNWTACSGAVRVRLSGTRNDRIPAYGEQWSFSGYLAQSTYKQGGLAGKPGALFFSGSAGKGRFIDAGNGSRLMAICLRGRSRAGSILSQGITDRPAERCILNSILLGYYSQLPRDLYQDFARTGTLHVFAISGSHVVIYLGAVIFILAACGLPRTVWILLLGPLLVVYIVMTGLQPSAVRAGIMGAIYWLAPLIGRKSDLYTAMAASAILILAVQPEDLANVGFILSYVAVLGLVLFCPVFTQPLHNLFQHDPLKLEPDPRWQERLRTAWRLFADMVSVSLAAWLVTAPLTAWFFGNFSPIGLPANLLVVPLSSLVIITGVLSLTLGTCGLWLADLFNHANLALIVMMTGAARWFAAIPGGCLKIDPPPIWAVLLFYALLLAARFALAVVSEQPAENRIEGEE